MTSFVSPLSHIAGIGSKGWTHDALAALIESSKPAHHHLGRSEVAPPRANKRELKTLVKQAWQNIECNNEGDRLSDVMSEEQSEEEQEAAMQGLQPQMNMNVRKRKSRLQGTIKTIGSNVDQQLSSEYEEQLSKLDSESNIVLDVMSTQSNYEPQKIRKLSEAGSYHNSEIWFMKKSSNQSSSSVSAATSSNDTSSHSSLIAKAYSLWETLKGRLISTQVLSGRGGNDGLSFECWNKHQFIISLSALNKLKTISIQDSACYHIWCLKCRNFLRKAEEKARSMNSTIISSNITQGFVAVKCENDHQFDLHYTRNFSKTWCEQCKNEEIQRHKEKCRKFEEQLENHKRKEQKRIFEECKRLIEEQQRQQTNAYQSQQEVNYYNSVTQQVCAFAKQKMEQYISSKSFKNNCTQIEVYNVYKIIHMPFDVLFKTLGMIERSQLNSHYRKLALILHPDKNNHEMASEAFKKLTQAYEMYKN